MLEGNFASHEGYIPNANGEELNDHINKVQDWVLDRERINKIRKDFKSKNSKEAIEAVKKFAELTEPEGHYSIIQTLYNKVNIESYTHAMQRLLENDFIMAGKSDELRDSYNVEGWVFG